jgi:sec-independent protein translocase protein TatA
MLGDILQPTHVIFILMVALLLLGPKRLPPAGRALGQGLREFKSSVTGERTVDSEPKAVPEAPAAIPQAPDAIADSREHAPAPANARG